MKNFSNYIKKEKCANPVGGSNLWDSKPNGTLTAAAQFRRPWWGIISNWGAIFLLSWAFLFLPLLSHAGSIKDVNQSIKQVQLIEPPLQFAVIGDSRDGEKVYTLLLKDIVERKPNFLIHLGDMIPHPRETEWQAFFEISKQINLPFFPVAGNHDVGTNTHGMEMYRKQFSLPEGKTYYVFRAGSILFVILDSEEVQGRIVKEQRSWLENTLSSSQETFKFVFLHRPLFPPKNSLKTGHALDKYPLERDDLHRLFVRTRVKAVFTGDDHRYARTEKDGILYLISGGGGAPLTAFRESGGYFHYVWISVEKEKIEGEIVDLEGQVQDRFVIE
jgi:predicted phosphodiesterase